MMRRTVQRWLSQPPTLPLTTTTTARRRIIQRRGISPWSRTLSTTPTRDQNGATERRPSQIFGKGVGNCNTGTQWYSAVPDYNPSSFTESFPSLVIGPHGTIEPQGSFAEMQAQFLRPDENDVSELAAALDGAKMGVVAHYYMDVELQSVLTALPQRERGLIGIADSLKMGDLAVEMCGSSEDVQAIACLGVDFMAESVATIMQRNGLGHVPVYRADARAIGCSLAESAERDAYRAWLQHAATTAAHPLHVVYINTSMETKAVSNAVVPTITCTSSNVLQTLLQASAQIPQVQIYYGPDTYMGHNLVALLETLVQRWSDEQIAGELHPAHCRSTLAQLRDSIHVFGSGNCVVHHMFGAQVVQRVRELYPEAHVTAHLEVPGEMFDLALQQSLQGRGVVGSTADILRYISNTVQQQVAATDTDKDTTRRLQFILGTEAGMVTSIVQSIQSILRQAGNPNVEAEIVFPVSSEAVTVVEEKQNEGDALLAAQLGNVLPGVSGGEGCSTAGGCATCPFMKMNDLDALHHVAQLVREGNQTKLAAHMPPNRLQGRSLHGKSAMDWAAEPVMYMRHFGQTGQLPQELVQRVSKEKL